MNTESYNNGTAKSSTPLIRIRQFDIAWELKATSIIVIFFLMKIFGITYDNVFFRYACRLIFTIFHVLFYIIFKQACYYNDNRYNSSTAKSDMRKLFGGAFKGIVGRAVIILAVHYQTHAMQPLIVSSVMGCFTILETKDFLGVLQRALN